MEGLGGAAQSAEFSDLWLGRFPHNAGNSFERPTLELLRDYSVSPSLVPMRVSFGFYDFYSTVIAQRHDCGRSFKIKYFTAFGRPVGQSWGSACVPSLKNYSVKWKSTEEGRLLQLYSIRETPF